MTRPARANLPVSITRQRAAGEPARQPVQRRVRRSGVEPENPRRIIVEHGEIGDPAEVQDRPPAPGLVRLPLRPKSTVSAIGESGAPFAAGRDVASAEVGDDVTPRPDRDHVAVADLERRPDRPATPL